MAYAASSSAECEEVASIAGDTIREEKPRFKIPANWAEAPEFVPRTNIGLDASDASYVAATQWTRSGGALNAERGQELRRLREDSVRDGLMCANSIYGKCPWEKKCPYIHATPCDVCKLNVMNPFSTTQQAEHGRACLEQYGMRCGICLEEVLRKPNLSDQRFGILPSCLHCFCIKCIRTWRRVENDTAKSCPECRVPSHFVCPSRVFITDKTSKDILIKDYLKALSEKPCRIFNMTGYCPFEAYCFYKHCAGQGWRASGGSCLNIIFLPCSSLPSFDPVLTPPVGSFHQPSIGE